jgi:hypothetical protein
MTELLRKTASEDRAVALNAQRTLAQALIQPLRSAVLNGDITTNIYDVEPLDPSATAEFQLDFLRSENEGDFIAYTVPSEGAIPQRSVVGQTITVQTFDIANAIDWPLKYARNARWNVLERAMEVLEAGFVRKINTDGWHALITAGAGRTDVSGGAPLIFDANAPAGNFTKRLISLMKTSMTRLAGGNSASMNRGVLTDLYISPEALEDIREWDIDDVDEITRREIFISQDNNGPQESSGPLASIYGVTLHSITELGVGQEYQNFFDTLGVSMGTSDEEIVVGLDLSQNDSFVMPIKEELTIFEDPNLHRRRKAGFYGWQEHGFGVLDARRVLLGSF